MSIPAGLCDIDNVAVEHITAHAEYHLPDGDTTRCGLPMREMLHPLPSAYTVGYLFHGTPCQTCYPAEVSTW